MLLGPNGQPVSSKQFARPKKKDGPAVGAITPTWQGLDQSVMSLPGGGLIEFDTAQLTLGDFRRMSEHPQIASSLHMLTFMIHQMDWQLIGGDTKVREHCAENLDHIWTQLIRAMSSAFKFGYSANALQWENRPGSSRLWINQIKDLVPERVDIRWKTIDGAPLENPDGSPMIGPNGRRQRAQVPVYDGIRIAGDHTIPVKNSFWYPLLRQNGDMRGTKLLRTAFRPWYFHQLILLFSNNYYERFGSPLPVGRAPYDDRINVGSADAPQYMSGPQVMMNVLEAIQNRSVVVMPSSRTSMGMNDRPEQDYQLEYLESSLRGAEFTDYLSYLNEEMSMALFTPLLLMRTGTNGSYGQSTTHMQIWQLMLNALGADLKEYIDRYILSRMAHENFGPNVEPPRISFRKMGKAQAETMRGIVIELLRGGLARVDIDELGDQIGLTLAEVEQLTGDEAEGDPGDPAADQLDALDDTPRPDKRIGRERRGKPLPRDGSEPSGVGKKVALRLVDQVGKGKHSPVFSWGHQRQLEDAFEAAGMTDPIGSASRVREVTMGCLDDVAAHMSKDDLREYIPVLVENVVDETVRRG